MPRNGPIPVPVRHAGDLRAFFDSCAGRLDQHGDDGRAFRRRIGLVRRYGALDGSQRALDLGCGDGRYLLALADDIGSGIGLDLSPAMVAAARRRWRRSGRPRNVRFGIEDAERLACIADASVDLVFAIGVIEHVIDPRTLCDSVWRVLRPGGRFVCLTPNGAAPLYRLGTALGIETRYLSSDRYLDRRELAALLRTAGFGELRFAAWSFVPSDDLPRWLAEALSRLDRVAATMRIGALRGGLLVRACKPPNP